MKRLLAPALACLIGLAALLTLSRRYDGGVTLGFTQDRERIAAQARSYASDLGLNTQGWKAVALAHKSRSLAYYLLHHPEDQSAKLLNPASGRVLLSDTNSDRSAAVTIDSHGRLLSFERHDHPARAATPIAEARIRAEAVMRKLTGDAADRFHLVTDGAESSDGILFGWDAPPAAPNQLTLRCRVQINGNMVTSAALDRELSASANREYDTDDNKTSWMGVIYGLALTVGTAAAIAFYFWASFRRRVPHRFVVIFCLVELIPIFAGQMFGGSWIDAQVGASSESHAVNGTGPVVIILEFLGFTCLALGVAGTAAAASGDLAARWRSAFDLFLRGIPSKVAGRSLLAGILMGPLIASLPLLGGVTGLFSSIRPQIYDLDGLFSASPLLSGIANSSSNLDMLLLFGFLLPAPFSRVRPIALRHVIYALFGLFYCAGIVGNHTQPASLRVAVSAAMFAALWYLYSRFDMLALLTAMLTTALCREAATLFVQPASGLHEQGWRIVAVCTVMLAGAAGLAFAGREAAVAETPDAAPVNEASERDRLMEEFSVAHRAQQEMLPNCPPDLEGYTLAASCTPAREVGGDLFDFLPLTDGRFGISVADVSGKGVPAALYMTLTKGLLAATTQESSDLCWVLDRVNVHLHAAGKRKIFVTMAMGFLDAPERAMEYARAGHNPIVWRRLKTNETRLVTTGGMGLGITGGKAFARALRMERLQLEPGDALVFYSDGLTEAMNVELEQYGEERLMKSVEETDGHDAQKTHDHILTRVREFLDGEHPQDDLTLVVLRVKDQAEQRSQ